MKCRIKGPIIVCHDIRPDQQLLTQSFLMRPVHRLERNLAKYILGSKQHSFHRNCTCCYLLFCSKMNIKYGFPDKVASKQDNYISIILQLRKEGKIDFLNFSSPVIQCTCKACQGMFDVTPMETWTGLSSHTQKIKF